MSDVGRTFSHILIFVFRLFAYLCLFMFMFIVVYMFCLMHSALLLFQPVEEGK